MFRLPGPCRPSYLLRSQGKRRPGEYYHQSTHQACLPCRAFFKRSVEQNQHQVYICYGQSNCVVTFKGRKTCKYCRFQVRQAKLCQQTWLLHGRLVSGVGWGRAMFSVMNRGRRRRKRETRGPERPSTRRRPPAFNGWPGSAEFLTKVKSEFYLIGKRSFRKLSG